MAKITINCGQCNIRNCQIKKDFRGLSSKYPDISYPSGYIGNQLYTPTFELSCPYKERKYKNKDKVIITIGIQRYIQKFQHDCLIDEYIECENCKFYTKCDGEIVTHHNTRYKKYIEIEATIDSFYKKDKYSYYYDYKKIEHLLNDLDKEFFEGINKKLIISDIFSNTELYLNFSKSKFIKKIDSN